MRESAPVGMPELPPLNRVIGFALDQLAKEDPEGIYSAEFLDISQESINKMLARLDPATLVDPETRLEQIKLAVEIISQNQSCDYLAHPEEKNNSDKDNGDYEKVSEHGDIAPAYGSIHNPVIIDDDDDVSSDIDPFNDNASVISEHSGGNGRSHPINPSNIKALPKSGDLDDIEIQARVHLHASSNSRFDDQVPEHVEMPDNEEPLECNGGENDICEVYETLSQYQDDAEGFLLPSVSDQITSEHTRAELEDDDAQVCVESDDGTTCDYYRTVTSKTVGSSSDQKSGSSSHSANSLSPQLQSVIYHGSVNLLTSKISDHKETPLLSLGKRRHDETSSYGIENEFDGEPLVKKARLQEYQTNDSPEALLRETRSFADKRLPRSGKSTSGKAPLGHQSHLSGENLLGQDSSLGGESLEEHHSYGRKSLPGTVPDNPWPQIRESEEDCDVENSAASAQLTQNPSIGIDQPSASPAVAGRRPAKRPWTDVEHEAIEKVVKALRKREKENGLVGKQGLRDERLWGYVSRTLNKEHDIDRTLAGCKYYWARFGRERSNFDERAIQDGKCKSTSVQQKKA